jgi:hypothetical protein
MPLRGKNAALRRYFKIGVVARSLTGVLRYRLVPIATYAARRRGSLAIESAEEADSAIISHCTR